MARLTSIDDMSGVFLKTRLMLYKARAAMARCPNDSWHRSLGPLLDTIKEIEGVIAQRCVHCVEPESRHVNGRCLFEPTTFKLAGASP